MGGGQSIDEWYKPFEFSILQDLYHGCLYTLQLFGAKIGYAGHRHNYDLSLCVLLDTP
jgi:hypothetical protein